LTQVFFVWFFYFIFYLIIQRWVDWKMSFVIFLKYFYIGLSRSHDSGRKFDRLTWVDYVNFFLSFLIGLYNLLSVDLFWSHDSSCRFDRLAQNNLVHFFGFFLLNFFFSIHLSILDYLGIRFHNIFFNLLPVELSQSREFSFFS
jgi:hypothetical protein